MDVFSTMFYEGFKFKKAGIYGAKQHYRCVVLHCRARIHTNCSAPQVILFASKHNHLSATVINNPDREDKKQESTNEKCESEASDGSNSTGEACERVRIPARVQKYAPTLRILSRASPKDGDIASRQSVYELLVRVREKRFGKQRSVNTASVASFAAV